MRGPWRCWATASPPITSAPRVRSRRPRPPGIICPNGRSAAPSSTATARRRGNHDVMMRGTFANIRIRNEMVPGIEGGVTRHLPTGEIMAIYDAAMEYKARGAWHSSSSRAKNMARAPRATGLPRARTLLGVRAVVAESFERIHRSNLIGMGVLGADLRTRHRSPYAWVGWLRTLHHRRRGSAPPAPDADRPRRARERRGVHLRSALPDRYRERNSPISTRAGFCPTCCEGWRLRRARSTDRSAERPSARNPGTLRVTTGRSCASACAAISVSRSPIGWPVLRRRAVKPLHARADCSSKTSSGVTTSARIPAKWTPRRSRATSSEASAMPSINSPSTNVESTARSQCAST